MNIKEKLQALLASSNNTTGETDTTLTDAVQSLIDGYGGGGGLPAELESVTEFTAVEDWTTDSLGNTEHFAKTYCNADDTSDRRTYVCYITGNSAVQNYRADFFMFQRYLPGVVGSVAASVNARNNFSNLSVAVGTGRSFYITAGSKVKVFVFKFGGIS